MRRSIIHTKQSHTIPPQRWKSTSMTSTSSLHTHPQSPRAPPTHPSMSKEEATNTGTSKTTATTNSDRRSLHPQRTIRLLRHRRLREVLLGSNPDLVLISCPAWTSPMNSNLLKSALPPSHGKDSPPPSRPILIFQAPQNMTFPHANALIHFFLFPCRDDDPEEEPERQALLEVSLRTKNHTYILQVPL